MFNFRRKIRRKEKDSVDTPSSADIKQPTHTFNILKREGTKLEPIKTSLIGFGGHEVETIGKVRHEVILGEFPKCAIHEVDFLVVDLPYLGYKWNICRPSSLSLKSQRPILPKCEVSGSKRRGNLEN
ncbi:hypothetical protein Leryth_025393 [Lithospermum erythrorhizon]|nr:hypothetical protein Leryth_025393 [Lithospermum erythrorhizon]